MEKKTRKSFLQLPGVQTILASLLCIMLGLLVGFVVLSGSYFVLKNFFYAEGSVGIIIEVVGGSFFLAYILRKGRL